MTSTLTAIDDVQISKPKDDFRNYVDSDRQDVVLNHYRMMRTYQTVEFVRRMHTKYTFEKPRALMNIREAFRILENYVDSSDPDISLPNMVHMLQTAEAIREAGHPDWFQLVGLIHDMGKIMFLWGTPEDGQQGTADGPQWALGGDTWIVGCKIPGCTVFSQFNALNPDEADPSYNTETGIYQPYCGLDNVMFAYGHDEYLYQMLVANGCKLPSEALAMIRFHSAYPWHNGGAYTIFMTDHDKEMMKWVLEFNKFDLYTKDQKGLSQSVDELWPYYQELIDRYLPGELKW